MRAHASVILLIILTAACDSETPGGPGAVCGEGAPCAEDLECTAGTCSPICPPDRISCGAVCCSPGDVCDLVSGCMQIAACEGDRVQCGATCCAAGDVCFEGACRAECPAPLCGAACCGAGESCFTGNVCCTPERECGAVCCDSGEVCDAGACKLDCGGGVPACGTQGACCAGNEICYLGECLVPGDACQAGGGCATRPEEMVCPEGQICDPGLGRCVPRQANEACVYIPPAGVFDPVPLFTWGVRRERMCQTAPDCQKAEVCGANGLCQVTWRHVTPAADDLPDYHQVTSIPMVVDLDADCVPEIIFNTYAASVFTSDGVLRAIRGDDGSKVWTVTSTIYRTDATSNPAIGDLDGDGRPEIFVTSPGKEVLAFRYDGTPLWISDTFVGPEGSASPTLANLDGAGDAEVVLGAAVFDSRGRLVFEGLAGRGYGGQGPISCVADLDGDGRPELIAGNTVYQFDGNVAAGTFAGSVRFTAMTGDGYCGIADFTGDDAPEVVLVSAGNVYLLQGQTGAVLAQVAIPGGGHGGAPNIADFDGDGRADIGTAGATAYVVIRFDGVSTLSVLWSAPTEDDSSSRTGSSVFDFDGDGENEVIYNDEEYVRIYPGVEPDCRLTPAGPGCDGVMTDDEILFRDLNSSRTRTEYPVIADVDGDFKAEIVFATSNEANFLDPLLTGDAGIEVWNDRLDNWVATRAIWNQHAYHITNVELLGGIPPVEAPSWLGGNDYRRNSQGDRETFCAPDLVVRGLAQDPAGCPDLVMRAFVVNQGCLGVGPGVEVALYDEVRGYLGSGVTSFAISPGASEQVTVRVGGIPLDFDLNLHVVVDDDGAGSGALNECLENNNTSDPARGVCKLDL